MCNRGTFMELCSVVEESLEWLLINGHQKWCVKRNAAWESFYDNGINEIINSLPEKRTPFEFQAEYLVNIKRYDARCKALVTDDEADRIREVLHP